MSTEDNHIVLKFNAIMKDIQGTHVELKNKHWLFTRKGFMTVIRILDEIDLAKDDEILVEDGKSVMRGNPVLKHKGKEVLAQVTGKVVLMGKKLYLTS